MAKGKPLVPSDRIEKSILWLRGQKVLLDSDLAALYGAETRALVQAVKRNADRFPDDFMFQLTPDEITNLTSHSVISSRHGGRRHAPHAFTEQGVAMLSSVLRSPRAIAVNIEIMRAFVRLRAFLASHKELVEKIDALERKYDVQFRAVFDAIRQLMSPSADPPKGRIGFR